MERVFALVDIQKEFSPASSFGTFGDLVSVVVRNAFVIAGVISFVLLVAGGFGIIVGAGAGDTKKLEQGKQAMTAAAVGLILVVASLWIVQIIEKVTGMPLLSPGGK